VSNDPKFRVGSVVGNYRLLRVLGEGGVGTVYEAEHVQLGRKMAVKLLHPDVATQETVTRFFNEARAVNEIRHPNIIDVEDFVTTPEGEHYMLMEMLEGEDLRSVIAREGLVDPQRVSAIGEQVASALAAVHRVNIIHRDLKPDNVFLQRKDGREVAKLLDFGVAKFLNDQQGVTRAGMTMGTPAYMAPEQIITGREHDVGPGADIYALGMVMYEALTGAPAFNSSVTAQVLRAHCFEAVEPPSRRRGEALPEVLESAVMKCLEKERANRFKTGDDLAAALRGPAPVELSGGFVKVSYDSVQKRRSRVVMMLPAFAMAAAALVIQLWPRSQEGAAAATAPTPPPVIVHAPPAPPPEVTLQLASEPPGAEVFLGDKRLGTTPLSTAFPMSTELVTLTAKFPEGGEVTQTLVPDRPLPEVVFVLKKPVSNQTPPKKITTKPSVPKTPTPPSSQNREGTIDPFK
jgi:serine/threonine-protein kinase